MKKSVSASSLIGFWPISDGVMTAGMKEGQPFDINIIQVYTSTSDHSDEAMRKLHTMWRLSNCCGIFQCKGRLWRTPGYYWTIWYCEWPTIAHTQFQHPKR